MANDKNDYTIYHYTNKVTGTNGTSAIHWRDVPKFLAEHPEAVSYEPKTKCCGAKFITLVCDECHAHPHEYQICEDCGEAFPHE